MANGDGFTPWPPADPQAFIQQIEAAWASHGSSGKHWILQVDGNNPISGYKVKVKQLGPGD
jgi:hypothetical protein